MEFIFEGLKGKVINLKDKVNLKEGTNVILQGGTLGSPTGGIAIGMLEESWKCKMPAGER